MLQKAINNHKRWKVLSFKYEMRGACGLAPVVLVGDKTYGRVAPDDIKNILKEYEG